MNMTINDKFLSLNKQPRVSQEKTTPTAFNANKESDPTAGKKEGQDSLDLSTAGQILHQSATTQPEKSQSLPKTVEQARTLVAIIRHQFEQSGGIALSAHSVIKGNQLDLLLRPDQA